MLVPTNVRKFEILLYVSLMLDALSVAFQDRTPQGGATDQMMASGAILAGLMILALLGLVRLAAQRRKNWARWVLFGGLVLSVVSLWQVLASEGMQIDSAFEVVSCALTALGLSYTFRGDARGWFNG